MTEAVTEPAPAKINPFLRVLGRRDDGYHDIETLILPISLADRVEITRRPDSQFRVQMTGPHKANVPSGNDDLAHRAARAHAEFINLYRGADIVVEKNIPVAAGLGGGSADAAAVLRGLDRLAEYGAGLDGLDYCARELGSDVPAMLRMKPVIAGGRGELLQPTRTRPTSWVLVTQAFGVAAREAYRLWDEDGSHTGPDPDAAISAFSGSAEPLLDTHLMNDLEASVAARYPEISWARDVLLQAGALGTVMCGSGPTVAGLASDEEHAQEIASSSGGVAVSSIGD